MISNANEVRETRPDDDLSWMAFCYLADELTPPQRVAFEERLAVDLEAAEALAQMTSLTETLYRSQVAVPTTIARAASAEVGPRRNQALSWWQRATAVAAVVAASWMLMNLWQTFNVNDRYAETGVISAQAREVPALAETWLQAMRDLEWETVPAELKFLESHVDGFEVSSDESFDASWIMHAVSGLGEQDVQRTEGNQDAWEDS